MQKCDDCNLFLANPMSPSHNALVYPWCTGDNVTYHDLSKTILPPIVVFKSCLLLKWYQYLLKRCHFQGNSCSTFPYFVTQSMEGQMLATISLTATWGVGCGRILMWYQSNRFATHHSINAGVIRQELPILLEINYQ